MLQVNLAFRRSRVTVAIELSFLFFAGLRDGFNSGSDGVMIRPGPLSFTGGGSLRPEASQLLLGEVDVTIAVPRLVRVPLVRRHGCDRRGRDIPDDEQLLDLDLAGRGG